MEELYKYYAHANSELYSMMEQLGPASGWSGTFPKTYQEHVSREEARLDHANSGVLPSGDDQQQVI
jgi:hypothetical protein